MTNNKRTIKLVDTHHHIFPPKYAEECKDKILGPSKGFEHILSWTPEKDIEAMDQNGFDLAVASVSAPGVWFGDKAQAKRLARYCNEYAAEMVQKYPDRFKFFATVPMPDAKDSVEEIIYAVEQLGADGVVFMTSYRNVWIGDPAFEEVYAVMNDKKLPAFVHPVVPPACHDLIPGVPENLMEFAFDTARIAVSLLYNGFMTRYPNVKWIFSHGGGAIPMVSARIAFRAKMNPKLAELFPNGPLYELKRQYFDVGSVCAPAPMAALRELPGTGQLLMGTDYPFGPMGKELAEIASLNLPADDLAAIKAGNALRMLDKTQR